MTGVGQAGPKVLLVLHMDDDPAMREVTSLMLQHKGHRVVSCSNVDQTVAAYRRHLERGERFDLVVLDLSIPGQKGGLEGLQEILALDPQAKVVACSGAAPEGAGTLDRGFVGFCQKPFTLRSLESLAALIVPARGTGG